MGASEDPKNNTEMMAVKTPADDTSSKDGAESGKGASGEGGGVKLTAKITLLNGITIVVGSMIGSGIFVSPTGVLEHTGSVGLSLIIWTLCGLFSMVGAYCFSELGTSILRSGGDYAYIFEAFGPFLAFLRLWVECIIVRPCLIAIVAMAFAYYVIEPLFPGCDQPNIAVTILAAICITILTVVNAVDVKWATRVQDIFTFAKLIALVLVIITGIVMLFKGHTEYLSEPFENTNWSVLSIPLAFYQGLFAYTGWNHLNCVTEELKDPHKNLPKAIWISMTLVTGIYVLTNVAYFTLVSPQEVLTSPAVAVTFIRGPFGVMWWVMPIFVALSTFGTVNGIIFTSARMYYVGAREGHMPQVLSMIQINRLTPAPAAIVMGLTSLVYLCSTDMYKLINYVGFVTWLSIALSVVALLYFRKVRPNMERPIKVGLVWPILYIVATAFLIIVSLFASPVETGLGCVIILSGVPVYFICVVWKKKPQSFINLCDSLTLGIQKLLLVVPEDKIKKTT